MERDILSSFDESADSMRLFDGICHSHVKRSATTQPLEPQLLKGFHVYELG